MYGMNFDENDVMDPDLMTATPAGDGYAGNIPISRHRIKI